MFLRTLASSSSGNCILVKSGSTALLVDAGISCRKITQRLKECGMTPADLSGILITHEHTDHVAGLAVLLKRWNLPLYASAGTCEALAARYPITQNHLMLVPAGAYFEVGELTVTSFSTPHDAVDSVGYLISNGEKTVAIATDLGEVPEYIKKLMEGAGLVLLESNHDVHTLRNGPYPRHLQERILSSYGHLCNEAAAEFAVYLAEHGTKTFVLAHLSKENNTPEQAEQVVTQALVRAGYLPLVTVAPKDELSEVFEVL
jgi:phosphoribosyl 1,2-cyclic phosphodiesterase